MAQKAKELPSAPLPFTAIVGLETARQALLLLAVDPMLAGVAIGAGAGTGKSALVRAFARMLANGREFDPTLPCNLVEMPVGVSEDRLLGGIDIEATLALGERVHRSGLLARANGGLLYVDSVNLLDDSTINHILGALDSGVVRVEREGISVVEPARFALLVTYDPAEGPPRRHLLDRLGLIVAPIGKAPVTTRAEVVRRNLQPNLDYEDDEALVLAGVLAARELLPTVTITEEQIRQLSMTALALGIEGHRADMFAMRAARAAAALAGRDAVSNEDLELAVRLVMLPRATRMPEMTQEEAQPPPPPPEPAPPPPSQRDEEDEQNDEEDQPPKPPDEELTVEDLILAAMETEVPPDILETPFTVRRRGRSGSRGTISGQRGRHIRSVPGRPAQGRLDVIATLRAAAPWQRLRASEHPHHQHRRGRIHLRADDLHIKKYRSKAGTLFCFLVDASGSMALHRMRQAKGAVNSLLQQAYVHRDQVALLAFRGERADLLLPPSQSVELAKRALDVLPTGGGTPLAAALLAAYQISEQARSRGIFRTTIVLITDGRPNVPLKADPTMDKNRRLEQARQEVQQLAGRLRAAGIGAVVIDTQRSFVSRGEAQQLAAWLGGRYVYLPNGRGDQIANAVIAASEEA
ncbi:magnesium chelatase ATPase subunit D [Chloroflexus islandicus]|uniref:Mg-protoporphyrin IX chelatase n=1 Tax=Chloroflexus islandicus TaxID=1707952 RepID=A0A178M8L2_9CHLR|nr:magnesium chelatase ATPase subunit D [Chloroflexus islandicus]OAN45089.1 magnesium chelatase ATPase subunit D [Chloroflexus islandicus]